jgi:hypothetical protein
LQDAISSTDAEYNFSSNLSLNAGLQATKRFTDTTTNGTYTSTRSNRIFNIPKDIGIIANSNILFDMYIRVGIPRNSPAGFQYISTCFSIISDRT